MKVLNENLVKWTGIIFIVLAILFFAARIFSPEDSWICEDGQWIKHGNPISDQPKSGCGPEKNKEVFVYYFFSNNNFSENQSDCSFVYPTKRTIPDYYGLKEVLSELFAGPNKEELKNGFSSLFSEKTANMIKNVKVSGKTAYVDLKDLRKIISSASTSCGSAQFLAEIKKTVFEFSGLNKIIFAIEGSPAVFYEWLQIGCSSENDFCDPAPFK